MFLHALQHVLYSGRSRKIISLGAGRRRAQNDERKQGGEYFFNGKFHVVLRIESSRLCTSKTAQANRCLCWFAPPIAPSSILLEAIIVPRAKPRAAPNPSQQPPPARPRGT